MSINAINLESLPSTRNLGYSSYQAPSLMEPTFHHQVAVFKGNGLNLAGNNLEERGGGSIFSKKNFGFKSDIVALNSVDNSFWSSPNVDYNNDPFGKNGSNGPNTFRPSQIDNTEVASVNSDGTYAIDSTSARFPNPPPMYQLAPVSNFLLPLPETLTMSLIPGDEVEPLRGGIEPPPILKKTNFTFDETVPPKQQRVIEQHLAEHPEFELFKNYAVNISLVKGMRGIANHVHLYPNDVFVDRFEIDRDFLMNRTMNGPGKIKDVVFTDQNTSKEVVMGLDRYFLHEIHHIVQIHQGFQGDDLDLEEDSVTFTDQWVFNRTRRQDYANGEKLSPEIPLRIEKTVIPFWFPGNPDLVPDALKY